LIEIIFMFKNHKTSKLTAYCLAGFIGLGCIACLLFIRYTAGYESGYQSTNKADYPLPTMPSNGNGAPTNHDLDYAKNSLGLSKETAKDTTDTTVKNCSLRCSSALSVIDQDLAVDDETYQSLGAYTKEISVYLQHDEIKRQHYLQLALTTVDSDKRSFLIDIFNQLPYQQKVEMGVALVGSDDWRTRAGGVTLIADHDSLSSDMVITLMDILTNEENAYVKSRILSHVQQESELQGNIEVLQHLDSVIYNGTEASVRVAALNAKIQLSKQPHHILPDAFHALRTSEPEIQLAGLVALDHLLVREQEYVEKGVYIGKDSIKNEIQNIRNLAAYGSDKKRFAHLIKEANTIYSRYFEYD
jgi:hypothetical protein